MAALCTRTCSYLPVLTTALQQTTGPVVELGVGLFSTPVLHWTCAMMKRDLVSYETSPEWFESVRRFKGEQHALHLLSSYDEAQIERPWDVAFVDHAPAERRIVEIRRLKPYAKYIIVHDTELSNDRFYHFSEVAKEFNSVVHYTPANFPRTSILSNLCDARQIATWLD